MKMVKNIAKSAFSILGLDVRKKHSKNQCNSLSRIPVELNEKDRKILDYITTRKLSMASRERLWSTVMACNYVVEKGIEGDFVECGVWRGGNSILAASVFRVDQQGRKVYLFDTFAGMTPPTDLDRRSGDGMLASEQFHKMNRSTHNDWCFASLEDVRANFHDAGLLSENITFVKGDVIETLNQRKNLPEKISILRLDTDWYESTRKELEVLYPRLSVGGVLIIDDYGHWAGAKKATDEYFEAMGSRPFLQYIDGTGRMGVKIA